MFKFVGLGGTEESEEDKGSLGHRSHFVLLVRSTPPFDDKGCFLYSV